MVNDFVIYRAVQHSLQLAVQVTIDIASHIITADFRSRVEDYREVITELGRVGVLDPDLAQRLAPLAGFRNIMVHDYLQVDPARVHDLLINGRTDLREFARQIVAYLKGE